MTVHVFGPETEAYRAVRVGPDVAGGERLQFTVPAGVWFGSSVEVRGGPDWALVGCVVSPGFSFEGFELAEREAMLAGWPERGDVVRRLTRGSSESSS